MRAEDSFQCRVNLGEQTAYAVAGRRWQSDSLRSREASRSRLRISPLVSECSEHKPVGGVRDRRSSVNHGLNFLFARFLRIGC